MSASTRHVNLLARVCSRCTAGEPARLDVDNHTLEGDPPDVAVPAGGRIRRRGWSSMREPAWPARRRAGGASPLAACWDAEPNMAAVTRLAARTRRVSRVYAAPRREGRARCDATWPPSTRPRDRQARDDDRRCHRGQPCQWTVYSARRHRA
jgi:hypothetical protein